MHPLLKKALKSKFGDSVTTLEISDFIRLIDLHLSKLFFQMMETQNTKVYNLSEAGRSGLGFFQHFQKGAFIGD